MVARQAFNSADDGLVSSEDGFLGSAENAKDDKSPERRLATAMILRTLVPGERAAEPDDFIRLHPNND